MPNVQIQKLLNNRVQVLANVKNLEDQLYENEIRVKTINENLKLLGIDPEKAIVIQKAPIKPTASAKQPEPTIKDVILGLVKDGMTMEELVAAANNKKINKSSISSTISKLKSTHQLVIKDNKIEKSGTQVHT